MVSQKAVYTADAAFLQKSWQNIRLTLIFFIQLYIQRYTLLWLVVLAAVEDGSE